MAAHSSVAFIPEPMSLGTLNNVIFGATEIRNKEIIILKYNQILTGDLHPTQTRGNQ